MFKSPMLLQSIEEPFDHIEWLSELKIDGFRTIYSTMENKIFTRHNNEITNNFPELNFTLPRGTILDGECVKLGLDNKPNFEDIMSWCLSLAFWKIGRNY